MDVQEYWQEKAHGLGALVRALLLGRCGAAVSDVIHADSFLLPGC